LQQWALTECISASQNCTIEGEGYMLELIINGVQYKSISAAAKALEIDVNLLSRRINGLAEYETLDQPPVRSHSTKPTPITINGKSFASISEAARFYDVNYPSFFLAIKHALETGEDELFVGNCKREFRPGNKVTIQGKTYVSWTEAARDLGVCYPTFVGRMKRGYYSENYQKINHSGTPVTVNGVRYQSHKECAKAYGLKANILLQRIRNGAAIDVAIDEDKYAQFAIQRRLKNAEALKAASELKVWVGNRGFRNYSDCARAYGLLPFELAHRMKYYGLTVEEAVDEATYQRLSQKIKQERAKERKNRKAEIVAIENSYFETTLECVEEYIW
jgi:hypothetical protein